MKIAHIGDAHWGLGYPGPTPHARFADICRTMEWAAQRIKDERCDLVLFAGDAFKDSRIFIDRASVELLEFVSWLRGIALSGVRAVVISGTPSHDPPSAYPLIREMAPPVVAIITEPSVIRTGDLSIACFPGMNRSGLLTQEEYRKLPPHVIHQTQTERITEACRSMPADILLAHLGYDLADRGFEDVLMQSEPVLTQEAVQGYSLVCLGHIHRPQQNGNVFYCGSPERLTFGDEGITPGFWIHEMEDGRLIASSFVETPARRFVTIAFKQSQIDYILDHGMASGLPIPHDVIGEAVVRVRYTCDEASAKRLDRRALERALYEAGAWYVAEIRGDVQRVDRARDKEVIESLGPVAAVSKWAQSQKIDDEEVLALQAMTEELLQEVAI